MIDFFIPFLLPSVNETISANRKSKYDGARLKRVTQDTIIMAVRESKAQPVERYPIFVYIIWKEPNRKRDPDNIAGAKKYIMDALQEAGIIRNDGWKEVAGYTDYFEVTDSEEMGVYVRIAESGE